MGDCEIRPWEGAAQPISTFCLAIKASASSTRAPKPIAVKWSKEPLRTKMPALCCPALLPAYGPVPRRIQGPESIPWTQSPTQGYPAGMGVQGGQGWRPVYPASLTEEDAGAQAICSAIPTTCWPSLVGCHTDCQSNNATARC